MFLCSVPGPTGGRGVGVGIGSGVGVEVGRGVAVGRRVAVGRGVKVGGGVAVAVGNGVAVAVAVAVGVCVGAGVAVAIAPDAAAIVVAGGTGVSAGAASGTATVGISVAVAGSSETIDGAAGASSPPHAITTAVRVAITTRPNVRNQYVNRILLAISIYRTNLIPQHNVPPPFLRGIREVLPVVRAPAFPPLQGGLDDEARHDQHVAQLEVAGGFR